MKYLKLCRNPAHKGYEDFRDGQKQSEEARKCRGFKTGKGILFCWYKIILGT